MHTYTHSRRAQVRGETQIYIHTHMHTYIHTHTFSQGTGVWRDLWDSVDMSKSTLESSPNHGSDSATRTSSIPAKIPAIPPPSGSENGYNGQNSRTAVYTRSNNDGKTAGYGNRGAPEVSAVAQWIEKDIMLSL
jgi:hypothetical protein